MSVNVRIKQKSLFGKKLDINDIIKISGLSYGICDENYRLVPNQISTHTLIYNSNKLARGIDVSMEGTDILLSLSLFTTPTEIRIFYHVIEKICKELKIKNYIREEEKVDISDKEKFIRYDEEASVSGLESLQENIGGDKYEHFQIMGVYNPISIGLNEITRINNNLGNLENYLHSIQSLDVYYAVPMVYRARERLIGIYAVGSNIPSVVPTKPYIIMDQIKGIEAWYVALKNNTTIRYEDFINNVSAKEYYDANHVIVTLSDDATAALSGRYAVEI